MATVFETLNAVNVNGHTEKKNGLTYLSWAWAWGEVKKRYPDAAYTIYENEALGGVPYFTDGRTCFVKTGLTIEGLEHIEYLPVMDTRNKSIPADAVTSFDVNKAIQRSLTKAAARHGLGLYIYAGEDLPEGEETEADSVPFTVPEPPKRRNPRPAEPMKYICADCGQEIKATEGKNGGTVTPEVIVNASQRKFGRQLCAECAKKAATA